MFLSVDGDSQDIERLFGALSAHIWLGIILNSGSGITAPSLVQKDGRLCHNGLNWHWSVGSLASSVLCY